MTSFVILKMSWQRDSHALLGWITIVTCLKVRYILAYSLQGLVAQSSHGACEKSSCYPATGDLVIGRTSGLQASSTCGLNRIERYCIVSHLEDDHTKCFVCDSKLPYNSRNRFGHRIENVMSTFETDWKLRWWQSENGVSKVYIQLDLEAEFHFTHLIMKFKTFRPAAMLIERSGDFGKTWKVYRYFAQDCEESFPGISTGPIENIQDVICESKYSDLAPSTEGEVIYRVLPVTVRIDDPYKEEVQDLMKITNLRVNFTKLHTLGDNLLDNWNSQNEGAATEKYYYALYSLVVRGSCSCYGHASRCLPVDDKDVAEQMVHGRCDCMHNTMGLNCEQCAEFFNDQPWRPARQGETNACKECQCHLHSTKCHFDPAVYEASLAAGGEASGGVCDDCQHNTMGLHCEQCQPYFYHDPNTPMENPHACRPCSCDPIGSEFSGECDAYTDPLLDLVAGQCHCKKHVIGRRCDKCQNGFWNLVEDNANGCKPCHCDVYGTVNGQVDCDQQTGQCLCKRFVIGQRCDECEAGYWGLDGSVIGCKSCDCDLGGAIHNVCFPLDGQCVCRADVIGQRCDRPASGYFAPDFDHLVYEAELASRTGKAHVVIREPVYNMPVTWSGLGFMKASYKDTIEFTLDNIPFTTNYSIVVRYESQTSSRWDDVRAVLIRPFVNERSRLFPGEVCGNGTPRLDRFVSLSPDLRHYIITPPLCLEKGSNYTLQLHFNSYRKDRPSNGASVLVDSIVLIPNLPSVPAFQLPGRGQSMRNEFEKRRCVKHQMSVLHTSMDIVCARSLFSLSAIVYDGMLACACNHYGSHSQLCNPSGGQCKCKPFAMGRQCNQCIPGTYGLEQGGCKDCSCNQVGSVDKYCDSKTGQCKCTKLGDVVVIGRTCNMCPKGWFNFPYCRRCLCNDRSDDCDPVSGVCLACRDHSGGDHCERCQTGYYGDPNSVTGCRECLCPGGIGSGFQHADTCQLSSGFPRGGVVCNCHHGYTGVKCDQCRENFYGWPEVPSGSCRKCDCNGNIDFSDAGSCDRKSGQCLKCLYNTGGSSCEFCLPGFYGLASKRNCLECNCNSLGTNKLAGRCDRFTGQCPCLPNVTGQKCDECKHLHWDLASGQGCQRCRCDPAGSLTLQCNEFDGRCICLPGRGGSDCSQCEDYHWGDPRKRCQPCKCNGEGSESLQCDRNSGACKCLPGVTGTHCDRCAPGTSGILPRCVPCGECYDRWKDGLEHFKSELQSLFGTGKSGNVISRTLEGIFKQLDEVLGETTRLMSLNRTSVRELQALSAQMMTIRQNLTSSLTKLEKQKVNLKSLKERYGIPSSKTEYLQYRFTNLLKLAGQLEDNATLVWERNIGGALQSTKDSHEHSLTAYESATASTESLLDSELVRHQIDDLVSEQKIDFDKRFGQNDAALRKLKSEVDSMSPHILRFSHQTCGGRNPGDRCDKICGGFGCEKHCGGSSSCLNGSLTMSKKALELSKRAELISKNWVETADHTSIEMNKVRASANLVQRDVRQLHDELEMVGKATHNMMSGVDVVSGDIHEHLNNDSPAAATDIRSIASEAMNTRISVTQDDVRSASVQILGALPTSADVDAVLNSNRENQRKVELLKQAANKAFARAQSALQTSQRVDNLIDEAVQLQESLAGKNKRLRSSIDQTKRDLEMVEMAIESIDDNRLSPEKQNMMFGLRGRLEALRRRFIESDMINEEAQERTMEANKLAQTAHQKTTELVKKYQTIISVINKSHNQSSSIKQRAEALKIRAFRLADSSRHVAYLSDMEDQLSSKEEAISDMQSQFTRLSREMSSLVNSIKKAAKHQKTCKR